MKNLFCLLLLVLSISVNAQVAVNTDGSLPDNSAMLDVKSTTKGMLIPRMTATQRDAIVSPATGLMIFCTDNNLYFSNNGTPAAPNWVIVNSKWLPSGLGISYTGGNVGIGTSTPNYDLDLQGANPVIHIKASAGVAGLILDKFFTNSNSIILFNNSNFTTWGLGTRGNDNFSLYNAGIFSEAFSINQVNNYAIFSGRVGIKTDPSYDLHINSSDYTAGYITTPYPGCTAFEVLATSNSPGTWGLYSYATTAGYAGYFSGNVYCTGSYLPSDEKLKENIQPLQNGLDKIMMLDVKTYTFKTNEFPELNLPDDRQNGFTAQNLESVFPELVKLNPAKKEQPVEFKAVNYTGLIPVLTEAIQEQQKQLEAKDARIDSLQKQFDDLKALVLAIQQKH